jgi:hypothetical protein
MYIVAVNNKYIHKFTKEIVWIIGLPDKNKTNNVQQVAYFNGNNSYICNENNFKDNYDEVIEALGSYTIWTTGLFKKLYQDSKNE